MQDCQELTLGRNSETPANTVGRGRLWPTRLASCGARLRRSITSGGVVSITAPATTADAFLPRLSPCASSAGYWNTPQKPEHGRRTDCPRPLESAGSGASMAAGCARCGKAPMDTGRIKQRGSTTAATMRRCNYAGEGREARTRSDSTTSAGKRRTSRRWGNAKRMQRQLSFGTRLSLWRDTRREEFED